MHEDAHNLHFGLLAELRARRRHDGGVPVGAGAQAEVEPTAVAALALGDEQTQTWLAAREVSSGFEELDGRVAGPATVALVALALDDAQAAARALTSAIEQRGLALPNAAGPDRRGWGWTSDARSLTEPTARVLLAVSVLTPGNVAVRAEALELLDERHCDDGGWNYGNASVNDVDLRGYAQTTAVALIALQRESKELTRPGLAFLRRTWRGEPGGLTTAQALLAFRLHGVDDEVRPLVDALVVMSKRASFRTNPLTIAWAALATGPDELLDPLRWRT